MGFFETGGPKNGTFGEPPLTPLKRGCIVLDLLTDKLVQEIAERKCLFLPNLMKIGQTL